MIRKLAKKTENKKILELGSGKIEKGRHEYSVKKFFSSSNDFIQSDIHPEYGHKIIDVTKMKNKGEFDMILCLNVLEHVFGFEKAMENMHRALKKNGTLVFFVPGFYPLHDEPYDYWRFTEHSIRKLFQRFRNVRIRHSGIRQYPFAYYAEAVK